MNAKRRKRFWQKVSIEGCAGELCGCRYGLDHCWQWHGWLEKRGYAMFWDDKDTGAARVMYSLYHGDILSTMHVCHACDNPRCVNIRHLWIGTQAENNQDRASKQRYNNSGARNPRARLTSEQIELIFALRAQGQPTKALASRFGVSLVTVSRILNGAAWKDSVDPKLVAQQRQMTARHVRHNLTGRKAGENNAMAILTVEQVRQIRTLYEQDGITQEDLARQFNISRAHISLIVNRKSWKHVE